MSGERVMQAYRAELQDMGLGGRGGLGGQGGLGGRSRLQNIGGHSISGLGGL